MRLDGARADLQRSGDLLKAASLRREQQDLGLTHGERPVRQIRRVPPPRVRFDRALRQRRTKIPPAADHLANRVHEMGRRRFLQDVRAGASPERLDHVCLARVHRQDNHPRWPTVPRQLAQHVQAAKSRHCEIEHQNVRVRLRRELQRRRAGSQQASNATAPRTLAASA